VFGNYGYKKKSVPVIFEPPCILAGFLKQWHCLEKEKGIRTLNGTFEIPCVEKAELTQRFL
jgi:hypothetical protein